MKLIIGLGNPGPKYRNTRHNIGFQIINYLHELNTEQFSDFSYKKKLESEVAKGSIDGEPVILMKPQTFMNNIGRAVGKTIKAFGVKTGDVILIQDDSDLEIGKIKIKQGGQGAGHRGIESIRTTVDINDMVRLLVGIRDEELDQGKKSMEIVLKKFPLKKKDLIDKIQKKAAEALKHLVIENDISETMNLYNGHVDS